MKPAKIKITLFVCLMALLDLLLIITSNYTTMVIPGWHVTWPEAYFFAPVILVNVVLPLLWLQWSKKHKTPFPQALLIGHIVLSSIIAIAFKLPIFFAQHPPNNRYDAHAIQLALYQLYFISALFVVEQIAFFVMSYKAAFKHKMR